MSQARGVVRLGSEAAERRWAFVVMPKLSLAMTEGRIVSWLKSEGQRVERDEPIFVMETEKVTIDVQSPEPGRVAKLLYPPGSTVQVNRAVAVLAETDEDMNKALQELLTLEGAAPPLAEAAPARAEAAAPAPVAEERLRVSPLARRLAEEHGIELGSLRGTGPGQRITKEDVLRAVEERAAVPGAPRFRAVPMSGMRRTIADRLSQSYRRAVHVTITMDVDATRLVELRQRLASEAERQGRPRPSYNGVVAKAVAEALKEHAMLNSELEGDQIKVYEEVNIGLAVAVEEGIVVPVVHNVGGRTLADVVEASDRAAEKVRLRRLTPQDVAGGTFTITNLGMYGVGVFTPIINPPQTAILGVGRIEERPIAFGGMMGIRPIMPLSLTFDHRVVDGAAAARFLQRLKEILENPSTLT